MPSNSARVNNRKFNLGLQPVRFRGLGCGCNRKMSSLGDDVPAGVPAGTILSYTGSWPDTKLQLNTPDAVQRVIQSTLANQWGIVIDSQWHSQSDYFNFTGKQTMTLQLHTTSDYAQVADVKSVVDGAIYNAVKAMPQSTARIVKPVTTAAGSPTDQLPADPAAALQAATQGYQDAIARGDDTAAAQYLNLVKQLQGGGGTMDWLSNNWPWLAAAGVGLVVAKEVL